MQQSFIEIDVRDDLALKKEPFDKIMGAVKQLQDGQSLILHAPFNPVPLHKVLGRKGFDHTEEKIEKKHWRVVYTKKPVTPKEGRI
ncbi:DUF2249 domain-containing protein [Allobacillus halotolerans]|uniref:DUF2249 domain-containing protein n=1 Tax=Allobacillus halotolerans TaxID=570278 RepID=A0ABS6GM17_9BACI|nr:DUF2249 domain-containing protein [Allobacillus halotolerans]MBU6079931.1 DUF2249 domain-containing protein [Allobacillus halotolerans]